MANLKQIEHIVVLMLENSGPLTMSSSDRIGFMTPPIRLPSIAEPPAQELRGSLWEEFV